MVESAKRFLVVGLGPAGGVFAVSLKAAGHLVVGVDVWREHVEQIRTDGLRFFGALEGAARLDGVHTALSELEGGEFDYVVVAVKAPVMVQIAKRLAQLGAGFQVVSLQNGIDTEEFLATYVGRERTMRVVVNYAGRVERPGVLKVTFFNPPNYIGCLYSGSDCEYARELASAMSDAGLTSEATSDIKKYAWRKTILNAALTPICSLLDMTMADVMNGSDTFPIVKMVLHECINVGRARGYDFGEGFLEYCLDYLSKGGAHKPSMLSDLQRGVPTEIDFLNGKIVWYGEQLKVPVPVNKTLTAMVKARERGSAMQAEKGTRTKGR